MMIHLISSRSLWKNLFLCSMCIIWQSDAFQNCKPILYPNNNRRDNYHRNDICISTFHDFHGSMESYWKIINRKDDTNKSMSKDWKNNHILSTCQMSHSSNNNEQATVSQSQSQSQSRPKTKSRSDLRAEDIANRNISSEFNGYVLPIAQAIDSVTGGWALSYADLSPENENTIGGQLFLATNIVFAVVGIILSLQGDWLFGGLTEIAGIVSYWYHYSQLKFGQNKSEVRLALFTDYITAGAALITCSVYTFQLGLENSIPMDVFIIAISSIICLLLGWIWEYGLPYIFWHSLWHILSGWTGYRVGQLHIDESVKMQISDLLELHKWIHVA